MDSLQEKLQAALGDSYRIDRELPGGGMSRLFIATERSLDRTVVVKVLPPELASEVSAARFQREMSVTAHLQHPHILPILTAGSHDRLLYYIAPYVAGESLRERLKRDGALPIPFALRTLNDVADALAFAHAQGVVHRDVKPENILLAGDRAVLADFGIARAVDAGRTAERVTAVGTSVGTPGYMAPEQIVGDSEVDARADVYALGVIGYEMLAGTPPYSGATSRDLLAAQMGVSPPPISSLRTDTPARVSSAITRALASDPALRPGTAGEFHKMLQDDSVSAARPAGSPRAARLAGAVGVATLVAAAAAWMLWARSHAPRIVAAPGGKRMVAVLPFSLAGRAEDQFLGPGMVDLLSTTLDGAGDLHTASPPAVLAAANREAKGRPLDPATARVIANRLGAGLYVLGGVVDVGGHLRVNAGLYDASGNEPIVSAVADGDTTDLFGLVDRLSAQLITGEAHGPSGRITQLASVTTQSLPALKAYLEGEAAFRANKFDVARDAFQRAVAADSAFALAYYRLSIAAEWLTQVDLSERASERAVRFSDRLSAHDRQLLAAMLAERRGEAAESERIYRSLIATYPDDIESWWQLGEILFHVAPLRGAPLSDAYAPFARVLALDPTSTPALVHLARVAAAAGDRVAVDSLVARALALAPAGERAYEMRVLRAAADGDSTSFAGLVQEFGAADDFQTWLSGWSLAIYVHRSDLSRAILARLTEPSRAAEVRARGHTSLAALDVMHGRLHDAESELTQADVLAPGLGLEYRGLVAMLPFRPIDANRVRAIRGLLESWNAAAMPVVAAPSVAFNANNGIHALIRGYLLGLCDAQLGDLLGAQREVASLPHAFGATAAPNLTQSFQTAITAEGLALSGHQAEAESMLAANQVEGYYEWFIGSVFRSGGRERFRHAQALAAVKQDTSAIRWFSSFQASSSDDLMYLAPSYLERARLEERLGRPVQAASDYHEFLQLWPNPDPELRPLIDDAQHRLAALGSQKN